MHEIITLQFGQQANYIGTHYWNIQESYFTYPGQAESPVNHDVSFRAGIGANGEDTYTPRTLIYDLKGAFGTLRRENALYELQRQEGQSQAQRGGWSGVTVPLQLPPIAPSSYQQALDQGVQPPQLTAETVRYWSDYNHLFYHPRSVVQLNEYELNSSLMPFERWSSGEDLFSSLDREHDLLDRDLRPFLEECDQLQGLQVLTGIDDAWGGFAARYLERIADDLGKGCRWVFGLSEGKRTARERQMLQLVNTAQSLHTINSCASMHLPLTSLPSSLPSYASINADSRWHTSAVQAALVESVTLPMRLGQAQSGSSTFAALETTLNNDGNRRIAETGLTVEAPVDSEGAMQLNDARMDMNFFPSMTVGSSARSAISRSHVFSVASIMRGNYDDEEHPAGDALNGDIRFAESSRRTESRTEVLFPMLSSYPRVFRFAEHPDKLSIKCLVSTTSAVASRIGLVQSAVREIIGLEDRETLCDSLASIAEEYEEGFSDVESYDED
ncbi:hypothetical protein BAUCODRAFT_78457 [Baudoinia panamericana UAMH 10762]|uniref:Tubulin nucleotide-binding domain-like protein n=1 Tax=Baudoinia panamericana (strain UAMH 10762) TaxID=717646 RepID=M2MZR9_BAUPA|nr:uncharacterized protein BAUCODRAFT_78457 [Baudoinia panamericana UAMH 10762]EMC92164.1 hypothetical protein BAUCODRAFT_78457 [Baudoinia panamericana UAMH 10762]